jgi:putative restriction endonuclease
LQLSEDSTDDSYDAEAATVAIQDMQKGDFSAEDREGVSKVRSKQQAFSNQIKVNYGNKCAICDLSTKQFLVGSHIIPWSYCKETRLDPSNGICLCSLHDKAFDEGFVTIDSNYIIEATKRITQDNVLIDLLKTCDGKKIHLPKSNPPNKQYLRYHRENIFEKHLTR